MNNAAIGKRIESIDVLRGAELSYLGQGESNTSFLAKTGNGLMVIRVARDDVPVPERFAREFHYLQYLEYRKISFAPTPIVIDTERGIVVVGYVPGTDASILDLDQTQQAKFIDNLRALNALQYDPYVAWCETNNYNPYTPDTAEERFRVNFTDRIKTLDAATSIPKVTELLKLVDQSISLLAEIRNTFPTKRTFLHDDLRWMAGGGNLRVEQGDVAFVDWELCGFVDDYGLEIGDVLGSIPLNRKNAMHITQLYHAHKQADDDQDEYLHRVAYAFLWGRAGNPLWAAERYMHFRVSSPEEARIYFDMVETAVVDLSYYLSKPYSAWF